MAIRDHTEARNHRAFGALRTGSTRALEREDEMMSTVKGVSIGLRLLAVTASAAQDDATTFDVVSIKRSPPNAAPSMRRLPDGQFVMTNPPLVVLLRMAWPAYHRRRSHRTAERKLMDVVD